jgi:membrane protease subunit HflC
MTKGLKGLVTAAVIVVILFIIFNASAIFVPEDRIACVKRFNEVTRIYSNAGLHFKVPFIETVQWVPKYSMIYSVDESDVLTRDRRSMMVSSYAV